jgi:23S rRNA pseudouridine1911/1915/1917 synthase
LNKKVVHKFTVSEKEIGQRIDLFVAEQLCKSRSQIQRVFKDRQIIVNKKSEKANYLLKIGDIVEILANSAKAESNITIPVIYEDNYIVIIDKPAGVSAHPAPGEKELTISEYFSGKLSCRKNGLKLRIVHRLDKGTSGLMILAKKKKAEEFLREQFRKHRVKKTYYALVTGKLVPKEGIIELPLKRDLIKRERINVGESGKRAKTQYKVKNYYSDYSYLELQPETGRTHQLRVHLSAIGYPIVGDLRYGKKSNLTSRIFLHAARIEFFHPETGQKVSFISKLPNEFKKTINTIN